MKKWILICPVFTALFLLFAPLSAGATELDADAQLQLLAAMLQAQANAELYNNAVQAVPVVEQPVVQPVVVEQPVVEQPAAPEPTPIGDLSTYVDVCIATQTCVYYENGNAVLASPCVTGSPGRSTPVGVFMINNCTPGKYLTGPTWHVWVDRWMRFSGNCGLHDASWRKAFGGDIYLHNGSHGCVNLPHDMAVALYDRVGIGTVVVVH